MDWSLVRGKTEVMSRANAAVKAACPQSVFPSCCDSEEGAAWMSLREANGVTLQQQLHCPTLMAMGDCRNGSFRGGGVVQTVHNNTLGCIEAIFLPVGKSMPVKNVMYIPVGNK